MLYFSYSTCSNALTYIHADGTLDTVEIETGNGKLKLFKTSEIANSTHLFTKTISMIRLYLIILTTLFRFQIYFMTISSI